MQISTINNKVFYRFVEFTSRFIRYELSHEDYKLIALDKKEANTVIEKKVKRLANAFAYLLHQSSQIIDIELIQTTYFLLTKKRIGQKNSEKILKNIYLRIDESPYIQASGVILIINKIQLNRKFEFSLLIANYILVKSGKFPIIFHELDRKNIRDLIKNDEDKHLLEVIYMYEFQTRHGIGYEESDRNGITLKEVIEILKTNQQDMMRQFKLKHLFIYGSLAKGSTHYSSDVDLLVDFGDEMINFHKQEYINEIQKYLKTRIKNKMDILDFSYSLMYAEIKEMNNTIKIF